MTDYHQIAALALAKCAAYDPWFPKASQAIVDSWAEQIERYKFDLPTVLKGVTKMYADNGSGFRPLPKDLTDAARAIRSAEAQQCDCGGPRRGDRCTCRDDYEARCEAKAVDAAELAALRAHRSATPIAENPTRLAALVAGLADRKAIDHA